MSLTKEELELFAQKYTEIEDKGDVTEADCKIIEFLLDNCEITVPDKNRFFVDVNCGGIMRNTYINRGKKYRQEIADSGLADGRDAFAYTGFYDFGHTSAEWDKVINLGIYGLKERITKYANLNKSNDKKQRFYQHLTRVYDASLRFIKRASEVAKSCGKTEMADGLENLSKRSPQTLFEAMQTSIVYYILQQVFDGTFLRTLGRLDTLFYPFFINENKEYAIGLIYDYLSEIDRFNATANIPFALGGTDIYGNSNINELSYLILDTYSKSETKNTKFHILCSKNIPTDFIENAFKTVRNGKNSIVFMSDEKIIESLMKLGVTKENATNYHVVGCYECGGNSEITCSCNARVSIVKALELTLNNGIDMLTGKEIGLKNNKNIESFGDLYSEFTKQLVHLCKCAMKSTDIYEKNYSKIHSAPIISATYTSALEKGGDLYCDSAAEYNNSSLNALGLATAVDSLAAIKKLVFEDKTLTLNEFTEILKSDWEGNEALRLLIKKQIS